MATIVHVVGARPNFMKVAPIYRALARRGRFDQMVVHTGQHYDERMSGVFLRDLRLPVPDRHLGGGGGSHAEQTARILVGVERVLLETRPCLLSVVGDVNSTLAAALAAAKLGIPVAHVEAGLRSFDRRMPEEINRLVIDRLAELLLTPSRDADENLEREGIASNRIERVGNVMIDSLIEALPAARALDVPARLGVGSGRFAVCTLHRPANVDDPGVLARLAEALERVAEEVPVVFPVHPRTRARIQALGKKLDSLRLVDPLGYLEFLSLVSRAAVVLTDSGGLQEETTALGVACLTLRESTERPVTVEEGTNTLVGTDSKRIVEEALRALEGKGKSGRVPALWDGQAAERISAAYERWGGAGFHLSAGSDVTSIKSTRPRTA